MKHIFAIILLICSLYPAQAQIVPNGGFEEWDSTYTMVSYPYPPHWKWLQVGITPCPTPMSETMQPSLIGSSGCCSVKLTANQCKLGYIYSGDLDNEPKNWAFDCMARPVQLNFQYMFQPEGGDSAYVRILLFHYDSLTPGLTFFQRLDTVGFASGYMHEEVPSFTPFSLPIQYFTGDTPAFMHILFSTSKTQSELYGNGHGGPPGTYASVGTSLWLDDVHLSGITGISERDQSEVLTVFPNPAGDRIWFKGPEITDEVDILIFDAKGAQVMDLRIPALAEGIDVGHLGSGAYSIALISGDSEPIHSTWVKE